MYSEVIAASVINKLGAKPNYLLLGEKHTTYILDVLWGQPIKLIQVVSNSELRENQWNDLLFFEIVASHCFGASEVQT